MLNKLLFEEISKEILSLFKKHKLRNSEAVAMVVSLLCSGLRASLKEGLITKDTAKEILAALEKDVLSE